jgi:hypothetical protein
MPRYLGAILYKYRQQFNGQIFRDYTTIRIDIDCPYNELQSRINELVREQQRTLEEDYNKNIIDGVAVRQEIYNTRTNKQRNIRLIRMRDPQAPILDGFPEQPWNTNQGTCVIDYLFHKYQLKRKIPTKEDLIQILQEDDTEDIITNGVSTQNIENFAKYIKIPMYVLNDFNEIEYHYIPPNSSTKHYPALVYRVSNQHFYPIEDPSKKKHYIQKMLEKNKGSIRLLVEAKETDDNDNIVYLETNNVKELIISNFKEHNIIPEQITMIDNELTAFTLNNITYKYQPYYKEIKQANNILNIQAKNISQFILNLLKKTLSNLNPISSHNSEILNQLIKAKENRIHLGYIDGYQHISIPDYSKLCAWDINKCYRYVLNQPLEKWIVLDWTDDWKPYNPTNKPLPLGLYYVETNDETLFKKTNIYSSSIINYAKKHTNIDFKIIKQLLPTRSFSKSIFKEYIDTVITIFGETNFAKQLINMLTGLMGRHKSKHYSLTLNTDVEQVLEYSIKQPTKVIVEDLNDDDTTPLYMYGTKYDRMMNETYIPIYIQIIDQSNIKLYEMMKIISSLGHKPIYRRTDCIVFEKKNKKIYPIYNAEKHIWGQFRKTDVPILNNTIPKEQLQLTSNKWNIHTNITNSNQIDEVYEIVKDASLCITGVAGTGKSYLVNKLMEKYFNPDRTIISSFTNRCALNWGNANTLHSVFKITAENKIGMKLDNFKQFCKNYDYIIIDEISMIPKDIWKIISLIKDNSKITFILIGDENQLAPIEFFSLTKNCYMNNSGVKYIADYNKIVLTDIQRYDIQLANILQDIIDDKPIDISLFPIKQNTSINLSYTNNTRIKVNKEHNVLSSLLIPKYSNSKYSQDMYIYEDCRIIAYRTHKKKLFVNSELYTVSHYDDKYIYIYTERNNEIHALDIPIDVFNQYFTLGYCMTAHKSQGSTITEDFNIYDWNKMDKELKYTSLSRAKKMSQVGIIL